MISNIKTGWLKNKNNERFAPKTFLSQVINEDGTPVSFNLINGKTAESLRTINATEENGSYTLGQGAIALGKEARALGAYSLSFGPYSTADSENAFACGYGAWANGRSAVAIGEGVRASGGYQFICGRFNTINSNYIYALGNGTGNADRSDAFTIDKQGNAEFQGDVKAYGCGGASPISLLEIASRTIKDWNQNDESHPEYVKNRTHWTGDEYLKLITSDKFTTQGESKELIPFLEEDAVYKVIWNGQEYICSPTNEYDFLQLGNVTIYDEVPDRTKEPFLFNDLSGFSTLVFALDPGEHSYEIYKVNRDIHELDRKYISYIPGEKIGKKVVIYKGKETTCEGHSEIFNDYKDNLAIGQYSFAEGRKNTAYGRYSHAQNLQTKALGYASSSEGIMTTAGSEAQHVQGRYNIADYNEKYAHIVGNGEKTWDENWNEVPVYSNAHTLDWDGNAWFSGRIKIGGTSYDDESAVELADVNHTHDWNDITNKPVEEIESDTLTWDGNTEGLICVEAAEGAMKLYKVSDAIVTIDDCREGITAVFKDGTTGSISYEDLEELYNQLGFVTTETILCIPSDNFYVEMIDVTFPEAGIYFANSEQFGTVASMTIPNYVFSSKKKANFAQNNPSAEDYIKNRTHYTELVEGIMLPETNFALTQGQALLDIDLALIAGETYTVNWNGTEYKCIAKNLMDNDIVIGVSIGNIGAMEGGNSTGEPFVIACISPVLQEQLGAKGMLTSLEELSEATLSITGKIENVNKLDNKYLDLDWLPVRTGVEEEIVSTTVKNGDSINSLSITDLGIYGQIIFYIDDERIEHIFSIDNPYTWFVGNKSMINNTYPNTGESYCIYVGTNIIFYFNDSNSHTVAIKSYAVNKLPGKYLPETFNKITMEDSDGLRHSISGYMSGICVEFSATESEGRDWAVLNNDTLLPLLSKAPSKPYLTIKNGHPVWDDASNIVFAPTNASVGSMLIFDGVNWTSITKEDLINDIIASLPSVEGGTY